MFGADPRGSEQRLRPAVRGPPEGEGERGPSSGEGSAPGAPQPQPRLRSAGSRQGGESAEGAPGSCSARPVRAALSVLRGCTNPPGPTRLLRGEQSRNCPLLLEAGAHPSTAPREPSPRTTGPAASDPSSEPLPRSSFFPSLRLPRKGRSSPLQSSLTTRGTTSTRWWREQECCSRPLSTASKLRGRVRSRRGSGGRRRSGLVARVPPGREGVGWCSRLPRGRGAQGSRRRCCCSCSRRSCLCRRRPRLSRRLH